MRILPRLLYLLAFLGMAASAAYALNGAFRPSASDALLRAVVAASLCGAAGLVHRKAWPLSLILLPVGAYLLLRTAMPPPVDVEGAGGLYRFYAEQLAQGSAQYARQLFPLELAEAPELRLLLGFTIYWLAGAAAFLALSLRRPVPGIALLLVPLGFGFTVDTIPQVLRITIIFLVLATCVLVLSRSLERRNWRLRETIPGIAIGAVGSMLAILLLGLAPAAAAKPWQDWREWDLFHQGSSIYSFNWLQNYPELLDPANDVEIMKVQSARPSYWRANALDSFTGEAWVSSRGFTEDIERLNQTTGFVYSIPKDEPGQLGDTITERFRIRSVYTNYLFTGGDPQSLTMREDVSLRINDTRSLHVVNALGPSLDYTLKATIPATTPQSLVGLGSEYPDTIQRYLDLPFPAADVASSQSDAAWLEGLNDTGADAWQWEGLLALNRALVGQADDPYDVTLRLERFLRQSYSYTLTPPASDYPSPYAAFLFDTQAGYCQHFAGTMAMLLRFNGIPARVAVGFTAGEMSNPGVFTVAASNAHAWVEAYFPTVGWVAFDPTPGRSLPNAGASSTSPGFVDPFASESSGENTVTTAFVPDDFRRTANAGEETGQTSGPGWFSTVPWLPWMLGLVALLVAWPLGRKLWRERGVRRGSLDQRFAASLRLLRASLSAYGVKGIQSRTTEEVLEIVDGWLGLEPDPLLVSRAGAVFFGGRPATESDLARSEAFRHEVEVGLRRRHGRVRALLTLYGVPPLRPTKRAARVAYRVPNLVGPEPTTRA